MALQVWAGTRRGCRRVRAQSFPLGVAQGRAVSETGKRETGWKAVKESQAFGCFQLPPRRVYGHAEGFFLPSAAAALLLGLAGRVLLQGLIWCQTSPLRRYGPLQAEQLCGTPCAATQPRRDTDGAGDGGTLLGLPGAAHLLYTPQYQILAHRNEGVSGKGRSSVRTSLPEGCLDTSQPALGMGAEGGWMARLDSRWPRSPELCTASAPWGTSSTGQLPPAAPGVRAGSKQWVESRKRRMGNRIWLRRRRQPRPLGPLPFPAPQSPSHSRRGTPRG